MKKTLVMGASLNPNRYSFIAINKLITAKHEVVAFGLRSGKIADVKIDTKLPQYDDIDTVTMYLNAKNQKNYYEYIIGLKPKRVIFNPGTENPIFYEMLDKNNIPYEIACTLVLLATEQY